MCVFTCIMHIFCNAPGPEAYYAIKDSFIWVCNPMHYMAYWVEVHVRGIIVANIRRNDIIKSLYMSFTNLFPHLPPRSHVTATKDTYNSSAATTVFPNLISILLSIYCLNLCGFMNESVEHSSVLNTTEAQ